MLFEKITYQDDFPINVTIASLEEYPVHYHQDIEFIYVLKGRISLKNGYCIYTLREGDIFVNAGHEIHSMYSVDDAEKNVVALIQITQGISLSISLTWGKHVTEHTPSVPPIQSSTICVRSCSR